jgi:cytochrome c biogenesis protein CcmG, thiol:disulfide interchange protein DsbE
MHLGKRAAPALLVLAGLACSTTTHEPAAAPTSPTRQPRPLPGVVLARLDAPAAALTELARGHVTVIDMWASWCQACKETTARVRRLAKAYAGTSLLVVGVNVGEARADVERTVAGQELLPTFLDRDFRFSDALGAHTLPKVLVVDKSGQIVHESSTLDERALEVVKRLLES